MEKYLPYLAIGGVGILLWYMLQQRSEPVQYSQPAPRPATLGPLPSPDRSYEAEAQLTRSRIASEQFANLLNYDLALRQFNFLEKLYLPKSQLGRDATYAVTSGIRNVTDYFM